MREIEVQCKSCGRSFSYSKEAVLLSLESGESEPLRCDSCRRQHTDEMRLFAASFLPLKPIFRSGFLTAADSGTYRNLNPRRSREVTPNVEGMEFGISDDHLDRIFESLKRNQVVVLVSGTGSGKSTLVPARLINPPPGKAQEFLDQLARQGKIALTEPRIPAVHRVAQAIGQIAGAHIGPGALIGYRHGSRRGESRTDGEQWNRYNRLVIVTDGSLRNWILSGEIRHYSLIIVDEAHERNKNIDVILGLLRRALRVHPRLKVLISSATINEEQFVTAFRNTGAATELINIPSAKSSRYFGPHFWQSTTAIPECDCWMCTLTEDKRERFWSGLPKQVSEEDLLENVVELVSAIAVRASGGSIVAFLHGQYEIEATEGLLRDRLRSSVPVLALFSTLGQAEIDRRLARVEGRRAILLATNIAETSLTIPGLQYVVDTGMIKENRWNPSRQADELVIRYHSKDGCRQRWGRVGRNSVGYVFALYTEHQFADDALFEPHTLPAIRRERLDDVVIAAASAGVDDLSSFPWIDPPNQDMIRETISSLQGASVLDRSGDLTPRGALLLRIPLVPQLAALLNAACQLGCLVEALAFTAIAFSTEGLFRLGDGRYERERGLFVWKAQWGAWDKIRAHRRQAALRLGCVDDLDFSIKVFHCFERNLSERRGQEWADLFFLNYDTLETARRHFKEILSRYYARDVHDEVRPLDFSRVPLVRSLIRSYLTDKTLRLVEPSESREMSERDFLDQWLPTGIRVSIHSSEGKPVILHPGDESSEVSCEWAGAERNENPVIDAWVELKGGPCAQLSARSEDEINLVLSKERGSTMSARVIEVLQDAYGTEGVVILETKAGLRFPAPVSALSLFPSAVAVSRLIGAWIDLDIIGNESDGRPILSYTRCLASDLQSLLDGGNEATCEAIIANLNIDYDNAIMVAMRSPTIAHGLRLSGSQISRHTDLKYLKLGERVLIRVKKKKALCFLHHELPSGRVEPLPQPFSYDPEEAKLWFPACLDPQPHSLGPIGRGTFDEVLRVSWKNGLEIELKSLKDRLSRLRNGDSVHGRIVRLNPDKQQPGLLKSVQILLKDGTPGFAFGNGVESGAPQVGSHSVFAVDKVDANSGYLRLVSGSILVRQLEGELTYLEGRRIQNASDLEKRRGNLLANEQRLERARYPDHRERCQTWIAEDRRVISSLEAAKLKLEAGMELLRTRIRSLRG